MRASLIILCVASLLSGLTGCGSMGGKSKPAVTRTFYGRVIEYELEPEAKEHLTKLEQLVSRSQNIDPPIPDDMIVPLYRDADMDRNHFITKTEAEVFYQDYILKFEDSLGSVPLHRKDNN